MVLCSFWQRGGCHRGQACKFEHSTTVSQPQPVAKSLSATANTFSPSKYASIEIRTAPPCVFYLQNACRKGVFCRFSHDQPSTSVAASDTKSNSACKFFLKKACIKGSSCSYSHEFNSANGVGNEGASTTAIPPRPALAPTITNTSPNPRHSDDKTPKKDSGNATRTMSGATITFGAGATISSVTLASDSSSIAITGIPSDKTVHDICQVFRTYGFSNILPSSITLHRKSPDLTQSGQVTVKDPGFAKKFVEATGMSFKVDQSTVQVNVVQLAVDTDAGTNRLHLAGFTCTWFEPSRIVYLQFTDNKDANNLVREMKQKTVELFGRRLSFAKQNSSGSVTISNVSAETPEAAILQKLPRNHFPSKVTLGPSSHSNTSEELERRIKHSLEGCGTLLAWKAIPQGDGSKVKATGKFVDLEMVEKAVKKLNNSRIDRTSKDKLRIQPLVSIKLSASQRILQAIRSQLEELSAKARASDFIMIKVYDNPTAIYTQIRISGQNRDSVAKAKSSVEELLSGHIVGVGSTHICRQYFFHVESTTFLESLMHAHNLYISHDRKKMALRLYGSAERTLAAERALMEKIEALNSQSKTIVLEPIHLNIAMRGGFRHLVNVYGKQIVKMDITSTPKCIVVHGSERLAVEVKEALLLYSTATLSDKESGKTMSNRKNEKLCPVCWTPPEEPFTTECGHTYCGDCLSVQCSSSTDFPILCLGDSANCQCPLILKELEDALPYKDYGLLLQKSLTNYIRSHPNDFQYCSTPDCDRFYRTSSKDDPHTFTCDKCLASTCTSCNRGAHDGLTCMEMKTALDGTSEFVKWKQENDVRDCPKCQVPIEKSFGCNHMECRACRAHICWFCMKTFEQSEETYAHMRSKHSGIQ